MNDPSNTFLASCISRMLYYKSLGDKTISQLSDAELHDRPNESTNNVAIIIRHMHGNMKSRWTNFLSEDGEKQWRDRDGEFEPGNSDKGELLRHWEEGWHCFIEALRSLTPQDLLKEVRIRGEALTVTDAIIRQLAHYAYHVGQIVHIGKTIRGLDWQNLSIPPGASKEFK